MINKKIMQRIARFTSLAVCLQLIIPHHYSESFAMPLALTIPQVSAYATGIAGALSASRYMKDMSTSLDEVARTMHDKLDNKWRYAPDRSCTSRLHMLDTTCSFPEHRTMQVPHVAQQSVEQQRAFNWRYATEPAFKQAVDQEVARGIKQLTYLNHPDVLTRTYARLMLVYEHLHVPTYQPAFEQLKTTLLKYCFDRTGKLATLELCNGMQKEISSFIKKLPEHYHYYQDGFPSLAQSNKRVFKLGDIASSVSSQQANQEIVKIIEHLKAGRIVEAHLHVVKANNPLAQQLYQHGVHNIFTTFKEAPHIRAVSSTTKAMLAKNPTQLQELYVHLRVRRELKEALCRAWHIQPSAEHTVHDAVYTLCDLTEKGELYFAQTHLIDRIEQIIKIAHPQDRTTLCEAFYLPNGLLKDRELHPNAQALEMPSSILHPEHMQQRTDLNKLFLIKELTNVDLERNLATEGIDCIKQGLLAEHPDAQQKYLDFAHASYEMLLSKNSCKQEQLLAKLNILESTEGRQATSVVTTVQKEFKGIQDDDLGDQSNKSKGLISATGGGSPQPNDPRNDYSKNNSSRPTKDEIDSKITKVNNMKEFFQTDFGVTLKGKVQKTNQTFQGQAVYELTTKVPHALLKKGDLLYLDALHKDHLEVFSGRGKFKVVLNLDGSLNDKKTNMAQLQNRVLR